MYDIAKIAALTKARKVPRFIEAEELMSVAYNACAKAMKDWNGFGKLEGYVQYKVAFAMKDYLKSYYLYGPRHAKSPPIRYELRDDGIDRSEDIDKTIDLIKFRKSLPKRLKDVFDWTMEGVEIIDQAEKLGVHPTRICHYKTDIIDAARKFYASS